MNDGNFYEQLSKDICITHKPGLVTSLLHKSLERHIQRKNFANILEIGGNVGEHLPFVKHGFDNYIVSDIRVIHEEEQNKELLPSQKSVTYEVADCQNLQYSNKMFDRVIVTCVLHHISELEVALKEINRVTNAGGQIDILLPCDPGMLYRFSRQISSLRKARKLKRYQEARLFHAREHRNHFDSILTLIKNEFARSSITVRYSPFLFRSWTFELFTAIRIKK